MTSSLIKDFAIELEAALDPVAFSRKILKFNLFPRQAEIISKFYQGQYQELVCVVGMRAGKTKLASVIALYEAFKLLCLEKPAAYYGFAPNQTIFIINTAVSKEQAHDTVFASENELLQNSPYFKEMIKEGTCKIKYNEIAFPEARVVLRSEHANSSSLVGRTCIAKGTRVLTPEGLIPIEETNNIVQSVKMENCTRVHHGKKPIIEIVTEKGYSLRCTPDHLIKIWTGKEFIWKEAHLLNEKDAVPILLQGIEFLQNNFLQKGSLKIQLTRNLGYIVGMQIGDGTFSGDWRIYSSVKSEVDFLSNLIEAEIGAKPKVTKHKTQGFTQHLTEMYYIHLTGYIFTFLKIIYAGEEIPKSPYRKVPEVVFRSNPEFAAGFLAGLFDAEGGACGKHNIRYNSKSLTLCKDVQNLLRLFGIASSIITDKRETNTFFIVNIQSENISLFFSKIKPVLKNYTSMLHVQRKSKSFPIPLLRKEAKNLDYLYNKQWAGKEIISRYVTKPSAEFKYWFDNEFLFDNIKSVTSVEEDDVYDLEVLSVREFTANGFQVHNSKLVIFDELSRFQDTKGKSSGWNVYYSLSRGVKTFGKDGLIVSISSPVTIDDPIMTLYGISQSPIERSQNRILGFKYATWEMNPNITRESLEMDFLKDPDMAMRDYGAEPSLVIENYYKEPSKIDLRVSHDLPDPINPDGTFADWFMQPTPDRKYFLAGDPAVKNDAFGLCMLHFEEHMCIVDLIHRFVPRKQNREIDAMEVASFIIELVRRFPGIMTFITDVWNYPETLQAISKTGILVQQHHVEKKEHDKLKEAIYHAFIKYYNHPVFLRELKELELVRGTKVDHRKGGSKDVADAVANAFNAATSIVIQRAPKVIAGSHPHFVPRPIRGFADRGMVKVVR